jgi:hypothetical protein
MNALEQLKIQSRDIFRKSTIPLAIIVSFGFLFFACNEMQNPVSELFKTETFAIPAASVIGVNETEPVVIQNFTITFNGNSYNPESNTSTFSYTVSRGDDGTGFNYMIFEVPSCAELVEYSPLESSSLTDDGIKWTGSIGANSSRNYKVTYRGEVLTGMVDATIQGSGSGDIESKAIPGPCKGIYSISGFVYVDENGDESRSIGEAGIGNVTVNVTDSQTNSTGSVVTSSDGSYTFSVFTGGEERTFKLEVPAATPENETDINELLSSTYIASDGAGGLTAVLGSENISGKNFGYTPDTQGIIEKFESLDPDIAIILNTKPPEYWENELKFATRGRKTDFTKSELLDFLIEIENLDLTFNFDFGSDKLSAAIDILSVRLKGGNQSTALEILKSELLAAKLNIVSGNGAVDGPGFDADEFNLLILKTGAAAVVKADPDLSGSLMMISSTTYQTTSTTSSLESDDDGTSTLLSSFNRSGTGGGGVGN